MFFKNVLVLGCSLYLLKLQFRPRSLHLRFCCKSTGKRLCRKPNDVIYYCQEKLTCVSLTKCLIALFRNLTKPQCLNDAWQAVFFWQWIIYISFNVFFCIWWTLKMTVCTIFKMHAKVYKTLAHVFYPLVHLYLPLFLEKSAMHLH